MGAKNYNEGDKAIVTGCIHGHGFTVGEEVVIEKVDYQDYLCQSTRNVDATKWFVTDEELD